LCVGNEPMDREKKYGILLIVLGFCIPLVALPFISGFSKDKGFYDNFYKSGIELRSDTQGENSASTLTPEKNFDFSRLKPKRIPFRFFLAFTVILLYMGITRIDRARRRTRGEFDGPQSHEKDTQLPPSQDPQ
jgi:hypothetical protein